MEKLRSGSGSVLPRLDLNNFNSPGAEKSRFVLTSPRSLESCARLGVKPVQLLIKSLGELMAERRGVPVEVMKVLHDTYEKERLKLVQMCRGERERIIHEAAEGGARWEKPPEAPGPSEPLLYADLCIQGKTCSRTPDTHTVSSLSLGDLRYTPNTSLKLQKITSDIRKEIGVTVSDRDCKIAALMLAKHEEDEARLNLRQKEEQRRRDERVEEEVQRAHAKIIKNKRMKQRMRRWNEMLEAQRRLRVCEDEERAAQLEQEIVLQENRWRRLKQKVEARRREKMEASHKDVDERKHNQEKLLREKEEVEMRQSENEMQVASEREEKVRRRRLLRERWQRKKVREENQKQQLRHVLLKQQLEQHLEEEEARMRSSIERRQQLSWEKHCQAVKARLEELQEHAAREQQQIQKVQLRAKLQNIQELRHKRNLVQLSQRRIQRATVHIEQQQRSRAEQTRLSNQRRQLCHQRLREQVQMKEETIGRLTQSCIYKKDLKREELQRQRQQVQEETQRLVRASFHMRDRVKQQIHRRTFDQMVLEAQLSSSISRIKL
ncbi:coiled-coil domain-containing protein 177 [Gouania willdenowi]|uniref:Coiled-coil domain-containing protein 177-like n=1 Tax=Gouania willdenowi TaxID=441366 RepID=A0A8C5HVF5_GOUWI|nr:coiled-coil domain-containing protein 177-like [Gouania willdenowi]